MKLALRKTLIATGLLCLATSSMAQWQWVDRSGRKVFSDRPPPAEVPARNIVKRPGNASVPITIVSNDGDAAPDTAKPAADAAPQAAASAPRPTAAQQKQQQEEEARQTAQRKAEEARIAKAKEENCQRARTALATLKTGVRLSTVNAKGEYAVMDANARATEEARLNEAVAANCQ